MDIPTFSDISGLHSVCVERFWHLVCHRSSVASHGSYLRISLGQHDLFVHNHHDELSCYVNKCPHRGSRIVASTSGLTSLQCPYHGWSFQPLSTSVPRLDTFNESPLDPRQARLSRWLLVDLHGFIFVGFKPLLSLFDQIGEGASNFLASIGYSIQKCNSTQIVEYNTSWTLAVENALEPYHISKVHPSTLGIVGLDDGVNNLWDWTSLWHASSSNAKLSRSSSLIGNSLDIDNRIGGYRSLYIFPFSMLSSTESLSFALQLYQPISPLEEAHTSLLTSLYVPYIKDERMRASVEQFYRSTSEMNLRIFKEDARISSLVSPDSWSIEPLPYVSTLELKINHFRDCCKNALMLSRENV